MLRAFIGLLLIQNSLTTPVKGPVTNMNGLYTISNPNPMGGAVWDSNYNSFADVQYFEVYSPPISTQYSEVYWTMMDPVPLPKELVAQFSGKTMAIVGYETDQVIVKEGEADQPVPITHAYNHHFEAYLSGSKSELRKLARDSPEAQAMTGANNHGAPAFYHTLRREDIDDVDDVDADPETPTSQFFSEGNGGEFRKSYHGYPKGMAQLIESPTTFHIQPMQIDTKNRDYPGPDFKAGLLPKASAAPPNASYSGLLECPCTDRIVKKIETEYLAVSEGRCPTSVDAVNECFSAANKVEAGAVTGNISVSSSSLPVHCSLVKYTNGSIMAYYNSAPTGVDCGGGKKMGGKWDASEALTSMTLTVDSSESMATIKISGPKDKWFAVSFGSPQFSMADLPYTIVVDGKGNVEERKLGNHSPGSVLTSMVRVTSNSVTDGKRTVIMNRPLKGATEDHYSFTISDSSIPMLAASGQGSSFAYHGSKTRTGGTLQLTAVEAPTCICNNGIKGSINGVPFNKVCRDLPYGDLVAQHNPTCWVDTYQGGLSCCHHGVLLLDKDQSPPEELLTYHLKFRFYYQPYSPATDKAVASHKNLLRMYYQTEAYATEYDVPQCQKGTPSSLCTHMITAHFTVGDMARNCSLRNDPSCWGVNYDQEHQGINLIYAGGHCHAPSCISMELYNADSGELLCSHYPTYGQTHEVYDELGYLALPPCLWGEEKDGLMPPVFLPFNANLTSIKRNNNTYAHYGEMASWQMRGILAKLPVDV